MNTNFRLRFSDAPWATGLSNTYVDLVGLGGIGSWIALMLSKMGVRKLVCYDMDTVEEHNVAGQLFGPFHIGMKKTDAVHEIVTPLIPPYSVDDRTELAFFSERYQSQHRIFQTSGDYLIREAVIRFLESGKPINFVLITALDSMTQRRECIAHFLNRVENALEVARIRNALTRDSLSHLDQSKTFINVIIIDPRMAAEVSHIVSMMDSISISESFSSTLIQSKIQNLLTKWNQYMFGDDEVDEGPCSYRSTTFASTTTASVAVSQMVNAISKRPLEENIGMHLPSGLQIPVKAWMQEAI